jgi:hypothetical protein
MGLPKLGVPSRFQLNFCMRGAPFMSQPPLTELLPWYTIQSSDPSGDLKKVLCPGD